MKRNLSRLLRPRSIAVIGGGAWCTSVIAQCRTLGFSGPVWPVHRHKTEVGGIGAYRALADLPGVPDAAFIGVNRVATIEIVEGLRALGCGGAVCFAAGFLEARQDMSDGAGLQARLLDVAGDMPVLGPNCYGFINYLDGALLWPDQHGGARRKTGVAVVMQSSNIAINLTMQKRGVPLAYVVTAGNQAQTGLSALGISLLEDDRVTALGLHIEGIDDIRGFEALAARARALGKPVVALKVGRSEQARAATVSHTASLAGGRTGGAALLARLGIASVDDLSQFLELLKLLHVTGPLGRAEIASMSCSGGEASLLADIAVDKGIGFPPLGIVRKTALRAILGPRVALSNPLDYNTYIWNDTEKMQATFSAMMAGNPALGVVIVDFPRADRCDTSDWDCVLEAVARTRAETGATMALMSSLPENMPESVATDLMARGVVPLCGFSAGVAAISGAAWLGREGHAPPGPILLAPPAPARTRISPEAEAKAALAAHGVEIPRGLRASSPDGAAVAACDLGFPVVLKGAGIAHKTEVGAVALNLGSERAVRAAARAMPTREFLVEEMLPEPVAELLIGVTVDRAHGYVLTLGAGGVMTEILADTASLLIPAPETAVRAALDTLAIAPLLRGARGQKAADIAAIVRAVMAVQDYVEQTCATPAMAVEEVEINPLFCLPNGAIAADALIVTAYTKKGKDDDRQSG